MRGKIITSRDELARVFESWINRSRKRRWDTEYDAMVYADNLIELIHLEQAEREVPVI